MADSSAAEREPTAEPEDPVFSSIERFSAVLVAAGFPPMPALVFVALLIAPDGRLSAAELAERLRISPAAVSGAVRYLTQLALVHRERVPGSRRESYRMPPDVWQSMMRMRDNVMRRWTTMMREGIELVGTDTPAGKRMAEHAEFFDFVPAELSAVMDRWERFRSAEHPGRGT